MASAVSCRRTECRPGLNLRRWGPRPSGRPGGVGNHHLRRSPVAPSSDAASWRNLYSLVASPRLGGDVSPADDSSGPGIARGRPLIRGCLCNIFAQLSSATKTSRYPPPTVATSCAGPRVLEFSRRAGETRAAPSAVLSTISTRNWS